MTAAVSRRPPAEIERRRAELPRPEFPPELPVSLRRADIARAIREHQVAIVCGETGSGKTTQLPKICLEIGRGVEGMIGHTQPRRIAARATAARIAHELKSELGRHVGFKIRFTDRTSPAGYIKLMTDGILLAETQGDPELRQYDTLIIDEAHERSLNIDFLLGYLKQLAPRRPDLKIIVTSATLDAERFARHFADRQGRPAPVIEVSGRLYPVETRYRPIAQQNTRERGRDASPAIDDVDLNDAIAAAVDELAREGAGDVLVFLPGEREIREAAETLRKHHPPQTEILPLYARLSAAEQERVFKPHGARRIVLATNVAETSLTVPGIRFVVDAGLARVKRYSYRNKVEQLQVERISQAAAIQRTGRCGRVQAGVCIRLYDEEDFARRPQHTDPEILRSSLAAVILRMKALGLPAIEDFPFIDPPMPRAIADGYALLAELAAVDESHALTETGRRLARLPVDPRIGRMVLAAKEEGSLAEVLVIAAALAVQDPRERPLDHAQAADAAQKRFAEEKSDFLGFLKLWSFYEEALHHESNRKLHGVCRQHFLSFNRMREWRDIHSQLKELAGELGWRAGEVRPADEIAGSPVLYGQVHRAMLAGLLGNVGVRNEEGASGEGRRPVAAPYIGARGVKFWVHPGSTLGKKRPQWVMAAEMTETTRLYARSVAGIQPEWLEQVGAHLIKRSQSEPHWEKKGARVVALERGVLYGLPVYINRRVNYGPLDPERAREIFIRQALVEGDFETRASFFQHNRRLVAQIETLEHKSRRPDVLVDDELIFAFYDSLVPPEVHDGAAFDAWRRQAEAREPKCLFLKRADLMRHEAAGITTAQFPHQIEVAGRAFPLEYLHDPGGQRDGVTMTVPLIALNQLSAARCDWLVPGLVKEKVQRLAKSLPQKLRHQLGPLPEFADRFVAAVQPADVPLADAIARYARSELNIVIPLDAFRLETLPAHLSLNFRVVDEHGRQLAMGRNLVQLRVDLGARALGEFSAIAKPAAARAGLTSWDFGDLQDIMEIRQGSQTLIGHPALVDRGEAVDLELFDAPEAAAAEHRKGLRRLFMLQLHEQARYLEKNLPGLRDMALRFAAIGDSGELKDQLVAAAFDRACLAEPLPRSASEFTARCAEARSRLVLIAQEVARLVDGILAEHQALLKKLQAIRAFPDGVRDVEAQVARLLPKDFVIATPYERLQHFPRYLKAASLRLDKLRPDPGRDARAFAEYTPLEQAWQREDMKQRRQGARDPQLDQVRWLLEELRVQLFAQELRTPVPVSVKRLQKLWQTLRRS
jgi:ATP-dependent RNA helicase HrpA